VAGVDPTGPDDWSSDRVETSYREARAVLEAQERTIADIDDKATRAVRINVLLLAALVSALQLSDGAFDPWLALCGGVSLFLSLAFGAATYHESNLLLGPSAAYLDDLNHDPAVLDSRWDTDLIDAYSGFIETNARYVEFNGNLLLGQQVFLVEGVLLFGLGIVV
jgi:hypothetical protein